MSAFRVHVDLPGTRAVCGVLFSTLMVGTAFAQQPSRELGSLINEYRSESRTCQGRQMDAAGPLAPDEILSNVQFNSSSQLRDALRELGYLPARVQAIRLTGAPSASAAMKLIRQRFCQPLLNRRYSDIGVSRDGDSWRIVLARPVLSPDLDDWSEAGREILRLTNEARVEPRTCGGQEFDAAPPLAWAPELAAASLVHSRDMAKRNYLRHRGKGGSRASDRAERKGYSWRRVGENIAAGQGSARQAVSAWLSSPPHCANVMNRKFVDMGAAYAVDEESDRTIYWTQVFGTPR